MYACVNTFILAFYLFHVWRIKSLWVVWEFECEKPIHQVRRCAYPLQQEAACVLCQVYSVVCRVIEKLNVAAH